MNDQDWRSAAIVITQAFDEFVSLVEPRLKDDAKTLALCTEIHERLARVLTTGTIDGMKAPAQGSPGGA